jgi:transcriptional regulator with XRE-family HTH domain
MSQPSEAPSATGNGERVRNAVFAANLRRLMRERGLTTRELASKIGVSHQSVSQWLSGQNGPTNRRLAQVATVFGLSVEILVLPPQSDGSSSGAGSLAGATEDTVPFRQLDGEQASSGLALDRPVSGEKPAKVVLWTVPPSAVSDEASNQSSTVVIRVDDNALEPDVRAGDYMFTDISYRAVDRPGVYLIEVAGLPAWRRCFPLLGPKVLVEDRFVKQEVASTDLTVHGRAVRLLTRPMR